MNLLLTFFERREKCINEIVVLYIHGNKSMMDVAILCEIQINLEVLGW